MDRKTLVICISALLGLLLLTAVSVFLLYRDPDSKASPQDAKELAAKAQAELLQAVPSDAVMVATFGSLSDAVLALGDPDSFLSRILTDASSRKRQLSSYLGRLSGQPRVTSKGGQTTLSIHSNGNMLLLISAGQASSDTSSFVSSLMDMADSCGLQYGLADGSRDARPSSPLRKRNVLALSPSETLIASAFRHMSAGTSILDRDGFPQAVAEAAAKDALYISHTHGTQLLPEFFVRPLSQKGQAFSEFALWTVLRMVSTQDGRLCLEGSSLPARESQTSFVSTLQAMGKAESALAGVAPYSSIYALSYSFADLDRWTEAYRSFLDGNGRVDRYDASAFAKGESGISPMEWAKALDIKEMARVDRLVEGKLEKLLFVKPGKMQADRLSQSGLVLTEGQACANPLRGYAAKMFGPLFQADDSLCVKAGGWLIYSASGYAPADSAPTLADRFSAMGMQQPQKDICIWAYYSPHMNPEGLGGLFRQAQREALERKMNQEGELACMMSLAPSLTRFELVNAKPVASASPDGPQIPVTVEIPQGPFRVKNSGTGKMNLFSQSANGSLSLREEGGKSLWAVPFSGKLCGSVETIDYYANGKLQFLFASGESIYLMDRLGRMVKSFPVNLGKEILLGPAAYDFTGAHGYTVMVLHTDNTIGMYDIHGKPREGWKGITAEETITALPELVKLGDRKFWAVRTAGRMLFFDFYGGETLTDFTGNRIISPTSAIETRDASVTVTCVDGKTRTVKL